MWLTGLVAPRHVGSSQTRARTRVPCIGRQILNHCTTREALQFLKVNPFEGRLPPCHARYLPYMVGCHSTLFQTCKIPPSIKPLMSLKEKKVREFPGSPVVRTLRFHCCGLGSIPGQGTKIPQAVQCSQKKSKPFLEV